MYKGYYFCHDALVPGRKVIFGQERLGLLRLVWIRM